MPILAPPNPSPGSITRCTQISRYSVIWGHPRMTPFEPKRGPKRGQNANILTLIWSKSSWMIWAHLGPPFWTPYWAVLDPFWVPPKSLYFVTLGVWIHANPCRCITMHRRDSSSQLVNPTSQYLVLHVINLCRWCIMYIHGVCWLTVYISIYTTWYQL